MRLNEPELHSARCGCRHDAHAIHRCCDAATARAAFAPLARKCRLRMYGHDERRPRRLRKVELVAQVAESRHLLAHWWGRVQAGVGLRIEPLAAEEVVLDELQVRVEAQRLMVDGAALRVRT